MKLRDILLNIDKIIEYKEDYVLPIQVRTNDPFGGDMLFGFCNWDGESLNSEDGDTYSLDDEVVKYELIVNFYENSYPYILTYWFNSEWTTGGESNE